MNYLAHARLHLDDPYTAAGTAAPDWMNVVARKAKLRRADLLRDEADERAVAFSRGVTRHHADDAWFHRNRAFVELSLELTAEVRDAVAPDRGMRPSFVGHVLVELLLDAELMRREPHLLDRYYQVLADASPRLLQQFVNRIATHPVEGLDQFVPLFLAERFLYDYAEDGRLLWRLNRVLQRVQLRTLPETIIKVLARARKKVASRTDELLTQDND